MYVFSSGEFSFKKYVRFWGKWLYYIPELFRLPNFIFMFSHLWLRKMELPCTNFG